MFGDMILSKMSLETSILIVLIGFSDRFEELFKNDDVWKITSRAAKLKVSSIFYGFRFSGK